MLWHWWGTLFGPGTWGAGGNMVAWVICGMLAFGWQRRENLKLHNLQVKLAESHHQALKEHISATLNANGSTGAET